MDTLTRLSRKAAIVALRATCLFGIGLVLGFAGFTASTMSSHSHLSAQERSVERPISVSAGQSEQASKGPHLVAGSARVVQVQFP
jgi:hypothetical protein